jgi:hypothetical protein
VSKPVSPEHFCQTLAVNVNNRKMTDEGFRELVRNTLPIVNFPPPPVREEKDEDFYYEIISPFMKGGTVVGCCTDPEEDGEEGYVYGLITKEQFEAYGDNPWEAPVSHERYKLTKRSKLVRDVKFRFPSKKG